MAPYKIYTLVCSFIAATLLSSSLYAEDLSPQDQRKATHLLNFTRFAKWHDETFSTDTSPINLCLSNQGEFKSYLNEKVKGRYYGPAKKMIQIVNFSKSANNNCHLSYIVSKEDAGKVSTNTWLKVGDNPAMAKLGTAINFVVEDEEVRFEINPSKLETQGVSMSSELLKLATIIKE